MDADDDISYSQEVDEKINKFLVQPNPQKVREMGRTVTEFLPDGCLLLSVGKEIDL